jgi:DNA-binding beta-propeller fold protein YncE
LTEESEQLTPDAYWEYRFLLDKRSEKYIINDWVVLAKRGEAHSRSRVMKRLFLLVSFVLLIFGCSKDQSSVGPDSSPPIVKSVISYDTTRVFVSFSEPVEPVSATDSLNYRITSYETLTINHVDICPSHDKCILITTAQESIYYDISITSIVDESGNRMRDTLLSFLGTGLEMDTTSPVVNIFFPYEGDTLYGFVYVAGNSNDNLATKSVSFFLNDSLIGVDYTFPYFCVLDCRPLVEGGTYRLSAVGEDYGRNYGYSDTINVVAGFHPPFPYVILDTIFTTSDMKPLLLDMTDDGARLICNQVPKGWGNIVPSEVVSIQTATNTIEHIEQVWPISPVNHLDVVGNNTVYLTSGSSVWIYDIAMQQVTELVEAGGSPQGVICVGNDRLYASRLTKQDVLVYSLTGDSIVDSIPVTGSPGAVALDSIHNVIYVCLTTVPRIEIIDVNSNMLVDSILLSDVPWEVCFSPACDRAYASEKNSSLIAVIDAESHTMLNELAISGLQYPKGIAVTADGAYVYATSAFTEFFVLDATSYEVKWQFELGSFPYDCRFNYADNTVYVTCEGDARIFYIGY